MGTIKQRENIRKESGGTFGDNEAYAIPLMKSRTQELEDRRRQKDLEQVADLKGIIDKRSLSLVRSEEHLPKGDMGTVSSDDLKKERGYRNHKSGTSYFVH